MRYARLVKLSDEELVKKVLANDESAIDYFFYQKYECLLKKNAAKTGADKRSDIEDLIQELYLYLSKNNWEKLRSYDPNYPLIAWFSTVSYRFFKKKYMGELEMVADNHLTENTQDPCKKEEDKAGDSEHNVDMLASKKPAGQQSPTNSGIGSLDSQPKNYLKESRARTPDPESELRVDLNNKI